MPIWWRDRASSGPRGVAPDNEHRLRAPQSVLLFRLIMRFSNSYEAFLLSLARPGVAVRDWRRRGNCGKRSTCSGLFEIASILLAALLARGVQQRRCHKSPGKGSGQREPRGYV